MQKIRLLKTGFLKQARELKIRSKNPGSALLSGTGPPIITG
jgi:hypothetical protein